MPTHSSVLAWRIPGTGEPGGLPSVGSQRVRQDCSDLATVAAAAVGVEYFERQVVQLLHPSVIFPCRHLLILHSVLNSCSSVKVIQGKIRPDDIYELIKGYYIGVKKTVKGLQTFIKTGASGTFQLCLQTFFFFTKMNLEARSNHAPA